jgi:biotin synthase
MMFQKLIERCEAGELLNPEEAILVLNENLQGKELDRIFAEADRRMRSFWKTKGRIWSAIGVDSVLCSRNCKFCSHAAAWGLFDKPHELTVEEVLEHVARLAPYRPDWITLRTTQDYGIDRLCHLVQEVRKAAPVESEIVVNTGEFGIEEAKRLKQAGVSVVYHTIRLREGIDTGLSIEDRIATLKAMQAAGLKMAALVEPLGPEHTDEEIVEAAFRLKPYDIRLGGVMARVPIPGTPLYDLGEVSEDRQVRVIAMTRLIYDREVDAICIHPPIQKALHAGANTVVVESGAIPRDKGLSESPWRGFSPSEALELFDVQI